MSRVRHEPRQDEIEGGSHPNTQDERAAHGGCYELEGYLLALEAAAAQHELLSSHGWPLRWPEAD